MPTAELTEALNLLAETTTMLADLHKGYPERELHRPLPDLVCEAKDLLERHGLDGDGAWDLQG